jgi:hypothetical protein
MMFVTQSQKDYIDAATGTESKREFMESETANRFRALGADPEIAYDEDLPPPVDGEEDTDLEDAFMDPDSPDGEIWGFLSQIRHDYERGINEYQKIGQERLEKNRELIPAAKEYMQTSMEEAANRSPRDIAAHGLDSTANTIYNFTKSGIDFTQIDDMPAEVGMALPALMEMYDRLPNGTWKGTQRFASSVIRDPVNFVGGVANFKLVRQLLAKGGTKAVREHLMERAAKAAGYTIIGAEGSAYAAMAEYMNQKLSHDPEQGEWQPDWPQIFAMGGFGAVAAAGGTAAIRAVPDAVRAGREIVTEKVAPAVRDLFDAAGQSRSTLTSGVDPTLGAMPLFDKVETASGSSSLRLNSGALKNAVSMLGAVPESVRGESNYFILPSGHRVRFANHAAVNDRSSADLDLPLMQSLTDLDADGFVKLVQQESANLPPPKMTYIDDLSDAKFSYVPERFVRGFLSDFGQPASRQSRDYDDLTDAQVLRILNNSLHRNDDVNQAAASAAIERKLLAAPAIQNIIKATEAEIDKISSRMESMRDKRYTKEYRVKAGSEKVADEAAEQTRNLKQLLEQLTNTDAPAEAGTTLTSGVDPTPAITAALNYAGRKTRKSGQVVGAPPEITSQRALTKLRRNLEAAAREGEPGRFWYERSGRAILDALGGDRAEADKLAQAIAITSSATGVDTNFDFALQAFLQHKAGQPVRTGRFPANMSKRIQEVFDGKDWEGRKTNNFYVNLMRVIDPSKAQGVTTDMWMMRAFGFKNPDGTPYSGTPTDAQYTFVEQETKRIADQLGWEPQQVQAAIWVANKARAEGKDVADAAFDYSDALLNNKAQVSWESIPGRTGNHLPEMFDAPYEVQQEYHVAISKAFLDEDGNDFVAKELGLPTPGDFEAPGYFEGKVSPGTQTELAIPRQFKGPKYGQVEPAAYDLMKTYAAIRGIAMKQDGVGFHRPFYNPKLSDTNGVELRIGRKFSENETKQLANILSELSGHNEYNPIGARDGVRIINFDFLNYDNKEFVKLVQNAVDSVQLDDDLTIQQMYFASQNGYVGNDWSVNKNGEEYTTAISGKGRSDLQRKIRSILPRLQTRIDEVDADFSERYGFTRNNALNEQYRDKKITQAVPEPGIAPAAAAEPIGIQPQQQE